MKFYKYQGTGNDFIVIDNREMTFPKNTQYIKRLCDRRFGIGGDGLILLENDAHTDFRMVYYNSDGNESTMCGNGGRCLVAFAHFLGIFQHKTTFNAIDGIHWAEINNSIVKLKMIDVAQIDNDGGNFVLNTGSPHFVKYVQNLDKYNVYQEGYNIRNSERYIREGINVNFVEEIAPQNLFVRTYERGVEDETLSCGTGATASALTYMVAHQVDWVNIKVLGGELKVYAERADEGYQNIWLEGKAEQVFSGEIE